MPHGPDPAIRAIMRTACTIPAATISTLRTSVCFQSEGLNGRMTVFTLPAG